LIRQTNQLNAMNIKTTTNETSATLSRKGTCIEFFSAYQDLDLDRMLGLCDPDGQVSFEPLGDTGKGKIYEVGKTLWSMLMDSFPDLDNTVINQEYNEATNSVMCQVSIFGTQEKDFAGISNKGKRFESDHIFIFRYNDDDKIDNISITWDHDSFVKQLSQA
jgi:ketosteroid isomerase-like protein